MRVVYHLIAWLIVWPALLALALVVCRIIYQSRR